MKTKYDLDIVEAIQNYKGNTNFNINSLAILCRKIIEENNLKSDSRIKGATWSILHTPLHDKTVKADKQVLLEKLATAIEVIYDELGISLLEIVPILMEEISDKYDSKYWEFSNKKQKGKREILVKSCWLINPIKKLYFVCAFDGKNRNETTYITSERLIPRKLYSVSTELVEFSVESEIKPKSLFAYNPAQKTKEYEEKLFSQGYEISLDYINSMHSSSRYSEMFDYVLNILLKKHSNDYLNVDIQNQNSIYRFMCYFLNLLFVEDETFIGKYVPKEYFSWSKDPFISNPKAGRVSIPKKILIEYARYLVKLKMTAPFGEVDYYAKEKMDDNNDIAIEEELDWGKYVSGNYANFSLQKTNSSNFLSIKKYWDLFTIANDVLLNSNCENNTTWNFESLKEFKSHKLVAITGPAGHGKTETIKNIIRENETKKVCVFAPTWKAALVYDDLIGESKMTKGDFRTIQSSFGRFDSLSAIKSIDKKSCYDLYVFDEVSMYSDDELIDIFKFMKISNSYFLFSGDHFQIPPIHSVARAEMIFELFAKFGSLKDLSDGLNYRLFTKDGLTKSGADLEKAKNNFSFLKDLRKEKIDVNNSSYLDMIVYFNSHETLIKEISKIISKHDRNGVTFIVKNNIGIYGTWFLNRAFRKYSDEDSDFAVGDQVIFNDNRWTKNGKMMTNSSIYTILEAKKITDSEIKYKFKGQKSAEYELEFSKGQECFEHALFSTAHKAQGSSINNVAVILEDTHDVEAEWLYTACSRVKDNLYLLMPSQNISFKNRIKTKNYKVLSK